MGSVRAALGNGSHHLGKLRINHAPGGNAVNWTNAVHQPCLVDAWMKSTPDTTTLRCPKRFHMLGLRRSGHSGWGDPGATEPPVAVHTHLHHRSTPAGDCRCGEHRPHAQPRHGPRCVSPLSQTSLQRAIVVELVTTLCALSSSRFLLLSSLRTANLGCPVFSSGYSRTPHGHGRSTPDVERPPYRS